MNIGGCATRTLVLVATALSAGCSGPPETLPPQDLGEPLAGLSGEELARFRAGEVLFDHIFTIEEGIGPIFNENQCSACHTDPIRGGTGEQILVKGTRYTGPGACDLLLSHGGENVRTQTTALLMAHGIDEEPFPKDATERGEFTVPFLFGLGLVEAIPEEAIAAKADPDDENGDGISGRVALNGDGEIGRFSRKADIRAISDFVDSALRLEMGLTTPDDTVERGIGSTPLPHGTDPAADPEVDARTVALLTDFVRFLAPPARQIPESGDDLEMIRSGKKLFGEIGCTGCHVERMATEESEVAALDRKWVYLYSDLLLHDLGPDLASVCGVTASPSETRTELLMGLGRRDRYLHDGRAFNLRDAIRAHGGEAAVVRARFEALDLLKQEFLIRFLGSL